MTTPSKIIYAQSSDIRSRTYLEYRRDMKKKAIAELEFMPFLQSVLSEKYEDEALAVSKHGGDAELWFGRDARQVTREPDYRAELGTGEQRLYEFQYAEESAKLNFFDFKLSKVGKKPANKPRIPHTDREFFYVVKPDNKFAFISPQWIMDKGKVGAVPAWGSRQAYRVPKDIFLQECVDGGTEMASVTQSSDNKNRILEFQHQFLDIENQRFSHQLQRVVDEEVLLKIVPRTLEGFYRVCYLLDKIQKTPDASGVWLVYLLSFFDSDMRTIDLARFIYSLDFLYFKCTDVKINELNAICPILKGAEEYILNRANDDGSFAADISESSIEGTRQVLFAVNLLEDIIQDAVVYWDADFPKIERIFQTLPDANRTASFIKSAFA